MLRDRGVIRAILQRDPFWSVYALGDLTPGYFEHCDWFESEGELALVYRATNPAVLFLSGAALPDEVPLDATYYIHVREEALPALSRRFQLETKRMWRMVLETARFETPPMGSVERLSPDDVPRIERLYADGVARGESPDFFFPSMVERGVFFGIREGSELAAVAGTHLVAEEEGVTAVGNVYTRADRRARGYGASVTAAVVSELLARRIGVVALQVGQGNEPAMRVYERLGFVKYCTLVEGIARPSGSTQGQGPVRK